MSVTTDKKREWRVMMVIREQKPTDITEAELVEALQEAVNEGLLSVELARIQAVEVPK